MNLINQLRAERSARRFRLVRGMSDGELQKVSGELVEMGSEAIGPLLKCLSHGDARGPTLEVLDQLLSDRTLGAYLEALASTNPAVASGVAKVLARNENYNVTALLELLTADRPPKALLESILRKRSSAIPPGQLVKLVPRMEKDGQAVAFRLLELVNTAAVVPELLRTLDHEDWWMRTNAVRLLSAHPEPPVVKALVIRLKDENKTVCLEAVRALHRMKATDAVPDLIASLRDLDYKVQTAAIDALVAIADTSALQNLLELLTDESEYVRRAAVEVLNEVATTEAIQDLVRVLRDEDWWVRVRAADALGALGGEKVVEAVMGLLHDEDDFIRRHAVEILNAVPNQRAVEALISALNDPDWWVRERSIDALGKSGDPRAVEPLLTAMSRDSQTIPLCVRALGLIGDTRALDVLLRMVNSEREEVRQEAIVAIKGFLRLQLNDEEKAAIQAVLSQVQRTTPMSVSIPMRVGARPPVAAVESAHPRAVGMPPPARQERMNGGRALPEKRIPVDGDSAGFGGGSRPSNQDAGAAVNLDYTSLEPGTVLLERYRVIRKIGRGGFGAIYLVEDSAVQDEMILKVLNPQLSADENALRRFVQELKLTRRITHRNVIRVHDFLNLGSAHAVAMEYFGGRDLGHILAEEGKLDSKRCLRIALQVCEGLEAAHAEGVIHRDLKPANLLIGEGDETRIVDFGLASTGNLMESRLTKSGVLIGTPEYMAPEQIAGEAVDPRSDIYSLGVVLYEMCSGVKPYTADTPVKVLFLHLEGGARPLRELEPNVSPGVERLVTTAMSREPEMRYACVAELRAAIQAELESAGAL